MAGIALTDTAAGVGFWRELSGRILARLHCWRNSRWQQVLGDQTDGINATSSRRQSRHRSY